MEEVELESTFEGWIEFEQAGRRRAVHQWEYCEQLGVKLDVWVDRGSPPGVKNRA